MADTRVEEMELINKRPIDKCSMQSKKQMIRSAIIFTCIFALLIVTPNFAFADDTTTTTTTLPTAPTTTITTPVQSGLDADLPGATTIPVSNNSKKETVAQENAKKATSKLDKATAKLLDAQLAADTASLEIQNTKASLAELQTKINKNEALLAVREMPTYQLSKVIEKRAVVMYQNAGAQSNDPIEEFFFNRQSSLTSRAQSSNTKDLKIYLNQVGSLRDIKSNLVKQKSDAEKKQADLEVLTVDLNTKLEAAKKEYEKTTNLFLDASALVGARLPIDGKMCPIAGPITHVDDWGNARSGGRTHKGNDIFNAFGTPNVAILSGRIEHNMDDLGGIGVNLFADDGNMYYYAHLSAWAGENRRVNQGDVIGYTGASGNAKGGSPHTHFEIRVKSTMHINPYPTIRIICGA